jgi:hypothetical protein
VTPEPPDLGKAHLRIAQPTDDLPAVVKFYCGLGFEVLYEFQDHDGFDGVMLGRKGAAYVHPQDRHQAGRTPTEDNLLVFYLPDEAGQAWRRLATSRFGRSTRTGARGVGPSRTPMATGLCFRMQVGPSDQEPMMGSSSHPLPG